MQRRTFLQRGLLGGALLALGGGTTLALRRSRIRYRAVAPVYVLDDRAFNVMATVVSRIMIAEGADPVDITHTIDQALARAVPEAQQDIIRLLRLLDNALTGFLLDGRLVPFTELDGFHQDAALLAWRDSRLTLRRGGYKILKNLSTTSFYRKNPSWKLVGYPGPPDSLLLLSKAGGVNPPGSTP
jgi:hypothetical protein